MFKEKTVRTDDDWGLKQEIIDINEVIAATKVYGSDFSVLSKLSSFVIQAECTLAGAGGVDAYLYISCVGGANSNYSQALQLTSGGVLLNGVRQCFIIDRKYFAPYMKIVVAPKTNNALTGATVATDIVYNSLTNHYKA